MPLPKSHIAISRSLWAHAQKHAPSSSDPAERMDPQKLARLILRAAKTNKKHYYPGAKTYLAALFGQLMPGFATRMMRRAIYEKLDKPVY